MMKIPYKFTCFLNFASIKNFDLPIVVPSQVVFVWFASVKFYQ